LKTMGPIFFRKPPILAGRRGCGDAGGRRDTNWRIHPPTERTKYCCRWFRLAPRHRLSTGACCLIARPLPSSWTPPWKEKTLLHFSKYRSVTTMIFVCKNVFYLYVSYIFLLVKTPLECVIIGVIWFSGLIILINWIDSFFLQKQIEKKI
jgi:hypothetical protein